MAKVLLIEDDGETASEIIAELAHRGFEVDWAASGIEGLDKARSVAPDAMIVDRMLPGMDGLTIIEALRQERVRTPVLVLSALGAIDDRVRGLRMGGDDYLTKPFALVELMARVEALLRRPADTRETTLRVGPLELELLARMAKRGERPIDLLPREFRLLEYMMRRKEQLLTRAMLLEEVWNYKFVPQTNLVDVHMGRLRRKVDESPELPMIHNVRGMGFILRALPEFARSTAFRWTLLVSAAFAACIFLLFGFVYWRTAAYMTARVDGVLAEELRVMAADAPARLFDTIDDRMQQDPRRVRLTGLFGTDGRRIAGNVESLPPDLEADSKVRSAVIVRIDNRGREEQSARAVARRLADGDVLMIGRNVDEVVEIANIVERALAMGLLPALCLSVATGVLLSLRAQRRVAEVNRRVQRIVTGDLHQRLPTQGSDDPFDKLATIVNGMLDEIEALINEVAGIGDDIAHDLRTPLTRVRVRLERGRKNARTLEELCAVTDQAIAGLDQSLVIITALLRIAEIENSWRLSAFSEVALADLVREVGDMYEPIAEDKGVTLTVDAEGRSTVHGDRDLLLEAVANLVDNAVKFTPKGGRVELALVRGAGESVVRVADTGPGIAEGEREQVVRRFYRSDKSRHTQGLGLGLSLVAAIVKQHGFRFTIAPGPGCVAEIACVPARG